MAIRPPVQGLTPSTFTEQRNDAIREGVKGLFLINGGGAAAMLAFLQATWTTRPGLARYIVICTALFSLGLALAGSVQLFRYQTSFSFQSRRLLAYRIYRFLYLLAALLSLGAFLVGVSVIVLGVWRNT